MHELGVTFHIMDHLEKVAKENEVEKIRKVSFPDRSVRCTPLSPL